MVVFINVKALSSPSPVIADFARTVDANARAGDVDDEELDDNEYVGDGEEKVEEENHDHDDEHVNKRNP